ncbi:hypothetical protein QUA70_19805 [Microcoleus sp. LAD1_D5]|uniref:hypothetical protein n=1 Tax=Microcoleus sp. LAD1_D5 TaxID=2818813 RepID=UPI002FD79676
MAVPTCAIDGSNCADGYGEYEDGEECQLRDKCDALKAYLDSPEKAESDRREAEEMDRIRKASNDANLDEVRF